MEGSEARADRPKKPGGASLIVRATISRYRSARGKILRKKDQ